MAVQPSDKRRKPGYQVVRTPAPDELTRSETHGAEVERARMRRNLPRWLRGSPAKASSPKICGRAK